jgi:hypothetical protein
MANIFDELEQIYTEIDDSYLSMEVTSRSNGQKEQESAYLAKRKLNDQAYFLFMFTRLEDRVRDISDRLIDYKVATLTDWKEKSTWEIINKQKKANDRLPFMDRVALLTQRGHSDYNLINDYYNERNTIGHGGISNEIYMTSVVVNMKRLYFILDI